MSLVNRVTILRNGDSRITLGDASHRRCITLQAARVHLFVGYQLNTAKAYTIKYI
ncbi:hypothetical protein D3C78_1752130 [compost metagenome]